MPPKRYGPPLSVAVRVRDAGAMRSIGKACAFPAAKIGKCISTARHIAVWRHPLGLAVG